MSFTLKKKILCVSYILPPLTRSFSYQGLLSGCLGLVFSVAPFPFALSFLVSSIRRFCCSSSRVAAEQLQQLVCSISRAAAKAGHQQQQPQLEVSIRSATATSAPEQQQVFSNSSSKSATTAASGQPHQQLQASNSYISISAGQLQQ